MCENRIEVICDREAFTYNAYHMVRAFYPARGAVSRVDEKASNYVTVRFGDDGGAASGVQELAVSPEDISVPREDGAISPEDVKELRYRIDRRLYHMLAERSGRELAWGILTGVRPTKVAMKSLEEGMEREDFTAWFSDHLLVSREKAELAWKIAVKEKSLLDRLDCENGYSLYVGIPFCPTVCTYCSFSSGALSDWAGYVEDYLAALGKELAAIGRMCAGHRLNTVYIGGGTPTSLSAAQLERLLDCIDAHFRRDHLLEYTVEAGRPDSITEEKLQVIKTHGVSRISVNPQSMQQKTLDIIGRRHTVEDVRAAYRMARKAGFDNINMDLIAGLPGETPEDMRDTLSQIEELAPDSLTVHSLAVKRAAKMGQESRGTGYAGDESAAAELAGRMPQMIGDAADTARRMGMEPYYLYRQKNIAGNFENVGYAKVDKAGIYNILIMEEKQSVIAAGAGASTKLLLREPVANPANKGKMMSIKRIENVKAIDAYIRRVDEMIERKEEWLWR